MLPKTPRPLRSLAIKCPRLCSITITDNPHLTDADVIHIARCPCLHSLDLSDCVDLTDSGVVTLSACAQYIQTLILSGCFRITDAAVTAVATCPALQTINLGSCWQITDVGVKALARCRTLLAVDLHCCGYVTDVGVRALVNCPHLHTINVEGCQDVTDDSLTDLASEGNLTHVKMTRNGTGNGATGSLFMSICTCCKDIEVLEGISVDGHAGARYLKQCSKLRRLDISAQSDRSEETTSCDTIELSILEHLTASESFLDLRISLRCTNLRTLHIFSKTTTKTDLYDETLAPMLTHTPLLEDIHLSRCGDLLVEALFAYKCPVRRLVVDDSERITDASLTRLCEFNRLQELGLRGIAFSSCCTEDGFKNIYKCENLTHLDVSLPSAFCPIQNDAAPQPQWIIGIDALQHLQCLDVSKCQVNDLGVQILTKCPFLANIKISDNPHITNEGMAHISKCLNLHTLDISRSNSITDVRALSACMNLTRLRMNGLRVSDVGISGLRNNTALTQLDASNNIATESAIIAILRGCVRLRALRLYWCPQLTDATLAAIAECLPDLRVLMIQGKFSDAGVRVLTGCRRLKCIIVTSSVDESDVDAKDVSGIRLAVQTLRGKSPWLVVPD